MKKPGQKIIKPVIKDMLSSGCCLLPTATIKSYLI